MTLDRKIEFVFNLAKRTSRFSYYSFLRRYSPPVLPTNKLVLINLGCGKSNFRGYINVDAMPYPHVHHVSDITRIRALSDNSADLVYASHILEHIPEREVITTLKEWFRIVKPGGLLRVSVPDFDKLIQIYLASGDSSSISGPLLGGQDDSRNIHRGIYNETALRDLLSRAGGINVRPWSPHTAIHHNGIDTSSMQITIGDRQWDISLNLEAEKI